MSVENQPVPTKEEFITHLKEQIEIAEVRVALQDLNTRIAKSRAEELNALSFIAQLTTGGKTAPTTTHTVTQEDLDENPELREAGIQVGQQITIPTDDIIPEEKPKERKLKKA